MTSLPGHPVAAIAVIESSRMTGEQLQPEIPLLDLRALSDAHGKPLRLTTWRENRRLAHKRRLAKRFISRNWKACSAGLRSVITLRQRPGLACELRYLVADPDVPTSTARKAAAELKR